MKIAITLIGLPGCGKTTLAKEFIKEHRDFQFLDVFEYLKKYANKNGVIPEEDCIRGYQDLFINCPSWPEKIILEIGTNYPRFNIKKLLLLQKSGFKVIIFLCLLEREKCLERAQQRKSQVYHKPALLNRLKRYYPKIHENILESHQLPYHFLDMQKSTQEKIKEVGKYL